MTFFLISCTKKNCSSSTTLRVRIQMFSCFTSSGDLNVGLLPMKKAGDVQRLLWKNLKTSELGTQTWCSNWNLELRIRNSLRTWNLKFGTLHTLWLVLSVVNTEIPDTSAFRHPTWKFPLALHHHDLAHKNSLQLIVGTSLTENAIWIASAGLSFTAAKSTMGPHSAGANQSISYSLLNVATPSEKLPALSVEPTDEITRRSTFSTILSYPSFVVETLRQSFRSLEDCPNELYINFVLKFFESYSYFAISQILVLYLHTGEYHVLAHCRIENLCKAEETWDRIQAHKLSRFGLFYYGVNMIIDVNFSSRRRFWNDTNFYIISSHRIQCGRPWSWSCVWYVGPRHHTLGSLDCVDKWQSRYFATPSRPFQITILSLITPFRYFVFSF